MGVETSVYEKIFGLQFSIHEMLLITKERDCEEFSRILQGIIEGKEVCTTSELLMEKHKEHCCRFKEDSSIYKKILIQESFIIRLMIEKNFKPSSFLKVLRAFKDGKKIFFGSAVLAAPKGIQSYEMQPKEQKISKVYSSVATNLSYSPRSSYPVDAISYLKQEGIPIFDISSTEQAFGIFFSNTEREKLLEIRKEIAYRLYEQMKLNRFSIAELKEEQVYIAVLPGILSLNAIRQKVNRFRAGIWYHSMDFAQMPTEPGVILGFGKPFALKEPWKEQKRMLEEYSKSKGIPFQPARTCEEIIGWLLDPKSQTMEGMMYNGYVRTADTIQEGEKKMRICVGNFNLGGIHIEKKDAHPYEHIGISRSFKLLLK